MPKPNDEHCCGIYSILDTYVLKNWQTVADPPGRQREVKEKCKCLACGRVWLRHIIQQEGDESEADWWKK